MQISMSEIRRTLMDVDTMWSYSVRSQSREQGSHAATCWPPMRRWSAAKTGHYSNYRHWMLLGASRERGDREWTGFLTPRKLSHAAVTNGWYFIWKTLRCEAVLDCSYCIPGSTRI
jgi:hypothetical protein